ncbi:ABC transporter ATP-binding protein [Paenibacillus xanthanilyticus]|uniref:ABC transporter ATP-binding protein n=1 Tax=Paenibacillus xanthanilyticus TaxID=1783531 RepID=A0ABV8K3H7_9BACL
MDSLTLEGIRKRFGAFEALKDVTLTIPKGKFTCLLGPSGCGKTTMLRIIAGLEQPDLGAVRLGSRDLTPLPPSKRNFGIVFQSYALFPNLTAGANIAYGLKGKLPRAQVKAKVREMLELVGLPDIHDRYPAQLSGGQQQRVALARAVALSPEVLLLDEPLSALDAKVRVHLREQLCLLQERLGITTVMVTHDQEEALTMADHVVVMDQGRVAQTGTPEEIYERPRTPFVADFIGAINFIPDGGAAGGVQAVRPEQIKPLGPLESPEAGCAVLAGTVAHAEFRGAYYRVSLLPEHALANAAPVLVDVPAQLARQLNLTRSAPLRLQLPAGGPLRYPAEALVAPGRRSS